MPEISPALYRAGQGEPLVLIHGFTATWRCWLPMLAELVPRFEVIAPTLHGHSGGAALPARDAPHGIAEATDYFEQHLDELGIETAHIVGNSLGGALALELAKRGRARSVVGISPAGGIRPGDEESAQQIIRVFSRMQKSTTTAAKLLPRLMARPGMRRLALRDVMAHGDQMPPGEAVALARSSIDCDIVDDVYTVLRNGDAALHGLDQVTVPTLILWGDRDRILPMERHAPRLRQELPNLEFRVLRNVGHTPMWDAPARLVHAITEFVSVAQQQAPRAAEISAA